MKKFTSLFVVFILIYGGFENIDELLEELLY